MLNVGSSDVRSSRHREARTRDRLGPAGARTAQVTAAELFDILDIRQGKDESVVWLKRVQHLFSVIFVDLSYIAKFMVPTGSFQEFPGVVV